MVGMTHGIARALSEGQPEQQGEYEAKSILLTGGAGFIASHVAIRIVQRYPEARVSSFTVHSIDRTGSKESFKGWLLKLPNKPGSDQQSCFHVIGLCYLGT